MATSRPFTRNTGAAIGGTTQLGNLAYGTPSAGFGATGLTWWMGPDESLGYIIAKDVAAANQPTPNGLNNGTVGFWRSSSLTDASFLSIANAVAGASGPFATAQLAYDWLNTNNYFTTFVPYAAGLYKTTYSGYFSDNVSFFATATPTTFGANPATSVQTTVISEPSSNDGEVFSCQWLGYFKPTTTETYTFYTSSDDASYVWVGSNAISGFTTGNATVNNGGLHGTAERSGSVALTSGTYYPIRIQFGENTGGDVLTFNYSTPTITKTTDVTGKVFYNTSTNGF